MRSRGARWKAEMRRWLGAFLLSVLCAAGATAAAEPRTTREQVRAAAERVRADPNMPGSKIEKSLRFKDSDKEKEDAERDGDAAGLDWLRDFAKAVAEGARWLVWGLAALAIAWLVVRIHRLVRVRAGGARARAEDLPSHVGSLDIRPQTLPEDIGGAAAALWQRGQHRGALSLLYRGALSRLVHLHAVPVRAASTEDECVALAAARLAPGPQAYFAQLVRAWQLAAYGGRLPATGEVLALCDGFDRHLGAPEARSPAAQEVPA